jgi:hypothetical protein
VYSSFICDTSISRQSVCNRNRFDYRSSSDVCLRGEHIPFFIRPCLKITTKDLDETLDKRWGELIEPSTTLNEDGTASMSYKTIPLRHFVNVTVKNNGLGRATNCEVSSRLIRRTAKCEWLSAHEKRLCWDDGEIRTTITPKGGTAIFHLVFSQRNLTATQTEQIGSVFCAIVGENTKAQAWMATKKALQNPEYRDQDGLCQGEFRIHLEVSTEYGHKTRNDLIIKVGENWQRLDAEISECGCYKKSRVKAFLHKIRKKKKYNEPN